MWKVDHINRMGQTSVCQSFNTKAEAEHFRESLEAVLKREGGAIGMWDNDPKPKSRWERLMDDDEADDP